MVDTSTKQRRAQAIRLTKLSKVAVFPKPLERQNVSFVCQIFNEKTVAALKALRSEMNFQEGTIIFIELITNWFKMMNIKDNYLWIHLKDDLRAPWTPKCESFVKLKDTCSVISSCRWPGGKDRVKK